jgi:hypothetical protein
MPTNNPEPNGHDVVCRFATVSELPLSPKLAVAYYNRVSGQLPVGRLLAANIFNLFFKRGFSEKCYSFPVGFFVS